jgi:dipeptidyl aminopeptidase/acylaminoacyl peptidase
VAQPVSFDCDGLRLAGELHRPEAAGPHPGLCICHGIPAVPFNPQDTGYHDLAARFAASGFATLLFNFRGAGLSDGDFDMLGWSRDVGAALTALSAVDSVDASRLFLMGFSGGAAASIHRAAYDARVSGVVSCASPADFRDLIEGPALAACISRWREIGIIRDAAFPTDMDAWVSGFLEVAPVAHVGRIPPRPLLLMHGDADEVVPVSHAHRLFEAAGQLAQLVIVPGGAHRLRVDERAMSAALEWLHSHTAS